MGVDASANAGTGFVKSDSVAFSLEEKRGIQTADTGADDTYFHSGGDEGSIGRWRREITLMPLRCSNGHFTSIVSRYSLIQCGYYLFWILLGHSVPCCTGKRRRTVL
jgi:hypothetical protein